jgi:hypothetical protein
MVVDRVREYMDQYRQVEQDCLDGCFDPTCKQLDKIVEQLARRPVRGGLHPVARAASVRRMIGDLQSGHQTFGTRSLHTLAAGHQGRRWFVPGEVEVRSVGLEPLYRTVEHGFRPRGDRYEPDISYESTPGGEVTTIRLEIDGKGPQTFIRPASKENENGPVDSIEALLREALTPTFPALGSMRLVEYRCHSIDRYKGTKSRVIVYMRLRSDLLPSGECFGTYVQRDIVKASFYCLCTAYLHGLALLEGKGRNDGPSMNTPLVLYVPHR